MIASPSTPSLSCALICFPVFLLYLILLGLDPYIIVPEPPSHLCGAPLRHQNCQETELGAQGTRFRGGMFVLPFDPQLIVQIYFPRHMDGDTEYFTKLRWQRHRNTMRNSYALRIYLPDVRMEQLHISGLRCEKNLQMLFLFIWSYNLNMRLNAESFHKEY